MVSYKKHLLIFLLCFLLTGCGSSRASILDPIVATGDPYFYGALSDTGRKTLCEGRHIAVSGTVSRIAGNTVYIDAPDISIYFSCSFSGSTQSLSHIESGDPIQLHGICTSVIGSHFYLDQCVLSEEADTASTSGGTTATAAATTADPTIPSTTEPTAPSTSIPPITDPKVPPETTPPVIIPPATNPDGQTDLVWIPKSGKKYHSKPSCSGMKDPQQISKEHAINSGYEPCKRCCS